MQENEHAQQPARDISHIDRQEGSMHHGETGGNWTQEEKKDKSSNEKNPR